MFLFYWLLLEGLASSAFCSKLLVTSGYSLKSEVIDLKNATCTCKDMAKFPKNITGATGGLLDDKYVVICGGVDDKGHIYDTCHVLGTNKTLQMLHPRDFAASVMLRNTSGDKLWLTGGSTYDASARTEFIYSKPSTMPWGESVPDLLYLHCMVKLNESSVMFIGGVNLSTVYFYTFIPDRFYGEWSEGPSISTPRQGHSCGKIQTSDDQTLVVVTGGSNGSGYYNSTELLDLSNTGQGWKQGPKLPFDSAAVNGSMVETGASLVYFGFAPTLTIYELRCKSVDSCRWETMAQKLQDVRSRPVGMLVPSQLTECCTQ